ncbi:MAG TPA: acylphosphatase [Acidimicrobiales bacterium]|nr:acylphosphatase [Acidimicrobiales bacterium]
MSGRVQGVWFRQSCADLAKQLGVSGWVRNQPDGRVEAVFEGDTSVVEEMVAWCRAGPRRAVVTGVEVVAENPEGCNGFQVT